MKVYTYKDALFTIEKNRHNAHYICKCEYGYDILKETFIGYNLKEVKNKFKEMIKYNFFMDDYEKQNAKIN